MGMHPRDMLSRVKPALAKIVHINAQQQPFSFFFFEAFSAFLEDFFEDDFSFFFEALAEVTAALAAAAGEAAPAMGATAAATASTEAGTGSPESWAISSGVSVPPAASFAKISGETLMRAGAAIG